ncbi:MAG: LapA family protein [Thermodesulfobacteriota bacterium]
MRFIRLLIIVLIIIFFAIIYTQNLDVFTHKFELQMDLNQYMVGPYITQNVVLILSAFVLGVVVSIIFGALQFISAGSDSRQKSRRIKELEAQVAELSESRNTPAAQPAPAPESGSDEGGSNPFSSPS